MARFFLSLILPTASFAFNNIDLSTNWKGSTDRRIHQRHPSKLWISEQDNNNSNNVEDKMNRRNFLSDAAMSAMAFSTTASAASLLPKVANAEELAVVAEEVTVAATTAATTEAASTAAAAVASTSSVSFPPIGLGAWAWGDSFFWGYDPKQDSDLKQVFEYAVDKDAAFFDTAEIYGFGRSETLLGQFRKDLGKDQSSKVQIATKFAALPWRTKPQTVVDACKASLKRLGKDEPIDLYQIHFPNSWANAEYWDGLAMCYEQGLVKSVGVSNYGVDALRATHAALKERGIPLATNQIQLSLLYRWPVDNGLLDACKELDVKVLSYSPLSLGFLTGKYSKDNLPSGPRKVLGEKLFNENENFNDLLQTMKSIASQHEDATLSQVALNWARAKGTIPIPGARNLRQAKQNIGALSWSMTEEEMIMLDTAAKKVDNLLAPDASPFPKKDINTGLIMFDS